MEAPIQQAQEIEGHAGTTPAPQATGIIAPPQSIAASQVEGAQSTSQAPAEGTPDFETARQIKNLMKEIRSLKQSFNTRPSEPTFVQPQIQAPKFTKEDWERDFPGTMQKLVEGTNAKTREEILNVIQQRESQTRMAQERQEGLNLIETNKLIQGNPQGISRIQEILLEEDENGSSLEKEVQEGTLSYRRAAQLALSEYQSRYGPQIRGAVVPSKAQMGSTVTAQTAGAGKSVTEAEITALEAQTRLNPELMDDPRFRAKMDEVLKKHDAEERIAKLRK